MISYWPISTFCVPKILRAKNAKFCAPQATTIFIDHFCNKNRKYLYRYSIFPQAQRAGLHSAAGEIFLRFLTFLKKKLTFLMRGESSHTCTTEPFAARVGPAWGCAHMLIRAHENAARGHIAFSHFGDAAAIISARGLVHKRWHAPTSAKAHAWDMHVLYF